MGIKKERENALRLFNVLFTKIRIINRISSIILDSKQKDEARGSLRSGKFSQSMFEIKVQQKI